MTNSVGNLDYALIPVLHQLEPKDWSVTVRVSRPWREHTLAVAREREWALIKSILDVARDALDKTKYPAQAECLSKIASSRAIADATSLRAIKTSYYILEKVVVDVLKGILERTKTISNQNIRFSMLQDLFKALSEVCLSP